MNQIIYTHTDESGVVTVEYELLVGYTPVEASGDGWNEPRIPAHIEDVSIEACTTFKIGDLRIGVEKLSPLNREIVEAFAEKLAGDDKFREHVEDAISSDAKYERCDD